MENRYKNDRYYSTSYEYFKSHEMMTDAGWIDEIANHGSIDFLLDLLTTPTGKLNFSDTKENKILLSTGSFAPFHKGHLNMMHQAKAAIEEDGYHVAGGYISPSHDDYVTTKSNMCMDIYNRIDEIENIIGDSEWLMIDKYEALYTPIPINFTTVIERLQQYLKFHLGVDVDIVYVFGGDNVEFSRAFISHGEYVCVSRYKNHNVDMSFMPECDRFRLINDDNDIIECDSTSIRKHLKPISSKDESGHYLLRNDSPLCSDINITDEQLHELVDIISRYSLKTVSIMDIDVQLGLLNDVLDDNDTVVSLDLYYKGDAKLDLCRSFDISDIQKNPNELVYRENEVTDLSMLPERVVIVDDDKASGKTMEMVRNILKNENISIDKEYFMNELFTKEFNINDIYDIVDFRDFLIGANYGGLCIKLPNGDKARCPYIMPYVNLRHRAKIDTKFHKEFTLDILQWNKRIFLESETLLDDVCPLTRKLFNYLGFNNCDTMVDICDWHINRIWGSV